MRLFFKVKNHDFLNIEKGTQLFVLLFNFVLYKYLTIKPFLSLGKWVINRFAYKPSLTIACFT